MDLNKKTVKQLRQYCRDNKIRGFSKYRKAELIDFIKKEMKKRNIDDLINDLENMNIKEEKKPVIMNKRKRKKNKIIKPNRQKKGKVYIASMIMRGKWAKSPDNTIIINVTSMQKKDNAFRKDFSPMTTLKKGYKGYSCFENYWQSGKVYADIDRQKQLKWWKKQTKGKKRYPGTRKKKVLYGMYEDKIKRGYINSRKDIYVPQYYNLMKTTGSFEFCKNLVDSGQDVVIYDFDGPRKKNKDNDCLEVNEKMLIDKINDKKFPFGHGYIIAATLAGIKPEKYTKKINDNICRKKIRINKKKK